MKISLNDELRKALEQTPDGIKVEDPQTQKIYILTEVELHFRAMSALKKEEDRAAIQEGIDDLEAGRGMTIEESQKQARIACGFSDSTES